MIIESKQFIYTDVVNNNNKFWNIVLHDNDLVVSEYGRVGGTKQVDEWQSAGRSFFDKKIKEKLKKGYTETKVLANANTAATSKLSLNAQVTNDIKVSNPDLQKLIDRLVKSNVHTITTSSGIKFDDVTGVFTTPLGVLTKEAIAEARDVLFEIKNLRSSRNDSFFKVVNDYYRLVPQKAGYKIYADDLFKTDKDFDEQSNVLDSLEASYNTVTSTAKQSNVVPDKVFDLTLDVLNHTDAEYERLEKFYNSTNKQMHGYTNIKIKKIYKVDIHEMSKNYNTKLGNDIELFHGTSDANVLSIMRSGLKVSPPKTAFIAGKMFGNGIYGAHSSSKSLGYTLGRWGGVKSSGFGYLFVCDFAMGKTHYPTGPYSGPPAGYDSCHAIASKTGLANDEYIVYSNNQIRVKYLLEVA